MWLMPDQPLADPIAQLKQNIAALEEKHRTEGIDLSSEIQSLRALLIMLEHPATIVNQSGGIDAQAERIDIGGDAVGRDKVTSHSETNTATDGSVLLKNSEVRGDILINSTKIIYAGDDPSLAQARLAKYLKHLSDICAPLKLTAIDQGAAQPGANPLGLTSVYVDLNLDLKIHADGNFSDHLRDGEILRRGNREEILERQGNAMRALRIASALEALAHCPTIVLLGKPGSGKSTLSTYLALSLAQAGRGDEAALARLGQDWIHGPLLPVRVILRQFAASLPADLKRGRADHLWDFIKSEVKGYGIHDELGVLLQKVADQSGALFLFDGLDEAGDEQRRARTLEAVTEFMSTAGEHCRFLITARPYAWEEAEQRIAQVEHVYRLADFDFDQIDQFITRWYEALLALGWVDDARLVAAKTRELQTAVRRVDLQTLAANPLLLTLMATLHSNRTTRLPDDRVDVYDEVVKLLLERWHKPEDGERSPLDMLGITMGQLRGRIEGLAYEAHRDNVRRAGTADIAEAALSAAFRPLLGGDHNKAHEIIQDIEQRAGLLVGQGVRDHQQQFTFPHRAFQEYLAACHLAAQRDLEKRTHELVTTAPDQWREVAIYAARIAGTDRGVGVADTLVHRRSCDDYRRSVALTDNDWRAAVLAGLQLLEIGLQDVVTDDLYRPVCERVSNWLLRLIETPRLLPLAERIEAGNVLGRLGDPRFETVYQAGKPHYILPPLAQIAAGPFEMGSNKDETQWDDEYSKATNNNRHMVTVPEFWISRYPVTNAEYALFAKATGAEVPELWREGEVPPGLETHPVVTVSWHDAQAYCRWLSEVSGRAARLPTEAEWEKAARWDATARHSRVYPWGAEWDQDKCNNGDLGLGTTTPVGIFADGIGPNDLLDAAGNVWEWTSSNWKEYPYRADDSREDLSDQNKPRVVRGGSWSLNRDSARCASRLYPRQAGRDGSIGFRIILSPGF
jgi:formylglycine-generating enzyme required for sulfatase activity